MEREIKERAERAIAEHVFPGCVIGITRKSGNGFERTIIPTGSLIYQTAIPVTESTIYDLASITKSIPLASLALTFVEESRLKLEDKIVEYIPELQNDYGATIEDLLRYRVHGPRMSTLPCTTPDEIETYIFEHGFDEASGEGNYSNLPAFLLGLVIERAGNDTLENLAKRYFFDPLLMRDTSFFPKNPSTPILRYSAKLVYDASGIAPTEIVDGKEIRGIVHDESARIFAKARRAVGHAGLFSTAPDLVTFLEFLLTDRLQGRALKTKAQEGLGWEVARPWMGKVASRPGLGAFGKTGFTGTSILCDAERGIGLVILSNRTYPHRPPDANSIHAAINSFRADIADMVFS